MITLFVLFLRLWISGIFILYLFALKNVLFGAKHISGNGALIVYLKSLPLAIIWPLFILSANGRRWLLNTLNLN